MPVERGRWVPALALCPGGAPGPALLRPHTGCWGWKPAGTATSLRDSHRLRHLCPPLPGSGSPAHGGWCPCSPHAGTLCHGWGLRGCHQHGPGASAPRGAQMWPHQRLPQCRSQCRAAITAGVWCCRGAPDTVPPVRALLGSTGHGTSRLWPAWSRHRQEMASLESSTLASGAVSVWVLYCRDWKHLYNRNKRA